MNPGNFVGGREYEFDVPVVRHPSPPQTLGIRM